MLRPAGVAVAVVALLSGLSAAPHTHAHYAIDSMSDAHHPHGATLVHAHMAPHSHHDAGDSDHEPAHDEDRQDQVWSVDSFVFQQPVPKQDLLPVLLPFAEPHVPLIGIWLGAHPPRPTAHGPPLGSPTALRAPPAFLPPLV